jgi:N-acetylmuramoyl-L-alanine amidase
MTKRATIYTLLLAILALAWPNSQAAYASADRELLVASSAASAAPKVNVAIQAGHWKAADLPEPLARLRTSTGANGGGRNEAQVTLDIAQRVAKLLRSKGLTVEVLPATVPTGYQADLFVSLHADGSASTQARGYKVSTRWRSEVAALDALLVQAMEEGYGAVTRMPQNGSITRAMRGYYAYSTYRGEEYRLGAETPAAIVEMGFMSNAADRAVMFNNPDLVARGVVAGIDNFYARRAEGLRLQAAAERQAAASPYGRSAVVLSDGTNVREGASTSARKVDSADFGESFPLLERSNVRPSNSSGSSGGTPGSRGTQLASNSGWYKIATPASTSDAYITRDLVVVQE